MDLQSETESIAENFAQKVQSQSSYMLSSRASRLNIHQNYDTEQQINQFKNEIEKKYTLSVANKIYTFPYTFQAFQYGSQDEKINEQNNMLTYCLHQEQKRQDCSRQQIQKHKNNEKGEEIQSKMRVLLQDMRTQRQKVENMLLFVKDSFCPKASIKIKGQGAREKKGNYIYGAIKQQNDESLLRKRLYTQPYQKPSGFIIKKK